MADRSVKVTLSASVGQYESNMRRAEASTKNLADTAKRSGDTAEQAHSKAARAAKERADSLNTLGTAMVAFGTVTVAALGFAAKAAVEWESAWAGVNKTVDGSPEQMAELEGELRNLATTLPITHKEIAGVAEAAGQLGVAREDITGFTKTMVDLGVSTNLSAEEAATSISQMMNVMQTAPEDVDNLGSALVELGNNGASTEADILKMAQRIAGTGKLIGASESDVLALSNTLASLGIKAESGGGSASRVLQDLYSTVESGGPKLDKFAKVAGMSAQEFATAFREDPIGAMDMFTQGLGRIKGEGGNVIGTLTDLGITATEDTRTLLALAGSGDMLTESLKIGNQAWKENTALAEEAGKRYETAESKIRTAWNQIKDAAIDAGAVILPVIVDLAETVAGLAEWFGKLPAPAQAALTALTGLAGVASLAGGAFLLLLPKAQEIGGALRNLGPGGAKAATALGKVGKAAGIATVALAGLAIAGKISDQFVSENASVEEFAQALLMASEEGENLKSVFADGDLFASSNDFAATAGDIDSVGDAIARVNTTNGFTKFRDWVNETFPFASSEISETKESLEGVDSAIASFAQSGAMGQAAESFRMVAEEAKAQGVELETTAESFPQYLDHLRGLAKEAGVAVTKQELLQWALGKMPPKMAAVAQAAKDADAADDQLEGSLEDVGLAADGTVESLGDYLDMLFATGLATLSTRDAQRQYQAAIDDVGTTVDGLVKKNGSLAGVLNKTKTGFNISSTAGRTAAGAFDEVASSGFAMASSMAESGASQGEIQGKLQGTYKDLITAAGAFGITGGKAKALAREVLGVPKGVSIKSWMSNTAKQTAENTKAALFQLPKDVNIKSFMSDAAYRKSVLTKAGIDNIPNSDSVKSFMSSDAFVEALRTRAAVLGIPPKDVIDSFMSSAARNEADATTAEVLGIPEGTTISSFMESDARGEANNTTAAINAIPKEVYVSIVTEKTTIINTKKGTSYAPRNTGVSKGPAGFADGGRLPLTGPGTNITDGILGVSSLTGQPTSYVDAGEWVVRDKMSAKYNGVLGAINADSPGVQHLAGLAGGGKAGRTHSVTNQYAAAAGVDSGLVREMITALRSQRPITLNNVPMDQTREVVGALNFEMERLRNSYEGV